jgi:hypothetical protein
MKRSGVNAEGNHYSTPGGTNTSSDSSYYYRNNDGSYYYKNDNGSTYYNTPTGTGVYTAPDGSRSIKKP